MYNQNLPTTGVSPTPSTSTLADEILVSRSRLMWLHFRRNKAALLSLLVLVFLYVSSLLAPFVTPYDPGERFRRYVLAPPQIVHFRDEEGAFHLRPFVYGYKRSIDPVSFRRFYEVDPSTKYPLYFLVRGEPYELFGLISTDLHLFGVQDLGHIFLLGTDSQGRDVYTRAWYGARVSLTVGLLGVAMSIVIGSVLGVVSGYFGGVVDNAMQRAIEILLSFPAIPLWMALAAAVPPEWSSVKKFLAVTVILSLINWGGLARQIRGMVLSLREQDFVLAARSLAAGDTRIILRHLLPNCFSHIIVSATLAIPAMILAETALSFLGLGIQPPMVSWGVLLQQAQNVQVLVQSLWLISPGFFVIGSVLAFNFVGDGLRDAADPYSS